MKALVLIYIKIFIIFIYYFTKFTTVESVTPKILQKQEQAIKLDLIVYTNEILCSFQPKMIYVYFENQTSIGHPGAILRGINKCGISYISIRKNPESRPMFAIPHDGILMYLVMIVRNAEYPIEPRILSKKSAAKHLTYVMLLIEDSTTITNAWLSDTFKNFWKIWILNVVIMFWRDNKLQVYRYNPFKEDEYVIKVAYREKFPQFHELYPKKLLNMQGKPLRICIYDDNIRAIIHKDGRITGSDGFMSSYITERLNATRIIHRNNLYTEQDRNTEICLREIQREMDDISINIRFLAFSTFQRRVESTIVHKRDDLCVLVPKAKTASTFWNLFRSFTPIVWLLIVLSISLAYCFSKIIFRSTDVSDNHLLELLSGTLSMPLTRIPIKFTLRIFLFLWMFYGMLISNAFKGNLTSNLVFRRSLSDINTMRDLAESPYDLLMFARHAKHLNIFLNVSNPYEAIIKRKMTPVPDIVLMQYVLKNNLSYTYLEKYHIAKFQSGERRHSRFGRPLYHVMATCLVPFHAVYIVPYGSPYLGFINTLVRSTHESGLQGYWENLMTAEFLKSGKRIGRSQNIGDGPVVLKLPHFQAAFCLLAIGLFLAFAVFLWELHSLGILLLWYKETMSFLRQT